MNKPIKIRKIWGQQVEFHPFTNMFYVKLGGVEFRDPQLDHLIKKIGGEITQNTVQIFKVKQQFLLTCNQA